MAGVDTRQGRDCLCSSGEVMRRLTAEDYAVDAVTAAKSLVGAWLCRRLENGTVMAPEGNYWQRASRSRRVAYGSSMPRRRGNTTSSSGWTTTTWPIFGGLCFRRMRGRSGNFYRSPAQNATSPTRGTPATSTRPTPTSLKAARRF